MFSPLSSYVACRYSDTFGVSEAWDISNIIRWIFQLRRQTDLRRQASR
jgi:hypothetical protein